MFVIADPVQTFKNSSTGLKLTKIRLVVVEKSRDQVKIEARMQTCHSPGETNLNKYEKKSM